MDGLGVSVGVWARQCRTVKVSTGRSCAPAACGATCATCTLMGVAAGSSFTLKSLREAIRSSSSLVALEADG